MNTFVIILLSILGALFALYLTVFFVLRSRVLHEESAILDIFLAKTSKIPALIEVMRPYVFDTDAFSQITLLHGESMVRRFASIYDLLEQNARIHNEFLFLMKLSMQIPGLQKDEYFLYIRDFIIRYERELHARFGQCNQKIALWNKFVTLKNITVIGHMLPGKKKMTIS